MLPRARGIAAVAIIVVAVLAIVSLPGGGEDKYTARLQLDDALGLRDGSKVVIGGVQVGRVKVDLDDNDRVAAELDIDKQYAPLGRDAKVFVTSVNLLGQKSLEIDPGDRTKPADSGFTIPAARVTPSTDLDQVLNVLDSNTRARLTVLINEAGTAMTGRRADISSFLQELPHSLSSADTMLNRLVADHHTLASLVKRSDRFVGTVTTQRTELADLLNTLGETSETFATKRSRLRTTLRSLPGTLSTARAFLDDLRNTTVPLGPAARNLSKTAAPLNSTLAAIDPFTKSATPALRQATDVAPKLTQLADGATPVLRRATPTLRSLAQLSTDLVPVTDTLRKSVVNIVATAANWAHAIQFRDGLGHVFRAEVAVTPQILDGFIDRLKSSTGVSTNAPNPTRKSPSKQLAAKSPAQLVPDAPAPVKKVIEKATDPVKKALEPVTKTVDSILQGLTGGKQQPGNAAAPPKSGGSASDLLDFLLKP